MDDFEREIARSLQHRVERMPDSYDARPASISRARRRRATKIGAFATAVVVVVAGTAAAVAQARNDDQHRLTTSAPTSTTAPRTSVATVRCPITYAITPDTPLPPPSTAPRPVTVPGGGAFVSYAATADPRYVLLGPKDWTCSADFAADGANAFGVGPPGPAGLLRGGITVVNDYLWHGGVGSALACSVSDDPAVAAYIAANFPQQGPCPGADRTLIRVDAHTTKFVQADGTRGAGWIVLPSSSTADDGKVSVLTCQPTTGLSAADCDVVIADWIARVDAGVSPAPTTTTTFPTGFVPAAACEGAGFGSTGIPPSYPSVGDPSLYPGLASFHANSYDDPRFTVLAPRGWTCQYQDRRLPIVVFDPTHGSANDAPIVIDDDWQTACSVFEDQAVAKYVADNSLGRLPCRRAGRTVTPVNAHVSTFVDADGTRGAAWVVLPAFPIDSGAVSVLTCRPTAGLTAAQCDTIVADYAARADAPRSPG